MPYTIKHYSNKSQVVPQFEIIITNFTLKINKFIALQIEVWTLNFNNLYKYQFFEYTKMSSMNMITSDQSMGEILYS